MIDRTSSTSQPVVEATTDPDGPHDDPGAGPLLTSESKAVLRRRLIVGGGAMVVSAVTLTGRARAQASLLPSNCLSRAMEGTALEGFTQVTATELENAGIGASAIGGTCIASFEEAGGIFIDDTEIPPV